MSFLSNISINDVVMKSRYFLRTLSNARLAATTLKFNTKPLLMCSGKYTFDLVLA